MESQSHMQDLRYKISHTVLKTKKLKKIKNVFLYKDINIYNEGSFGSDDTECESSKIEIFLTII